MNNKLYHHGIKGQRWGVRRFQNEDGSLTSAGRARYLKSDGSPTRAGRKEIRKFKRKVNKGWMNSYDRATDKFNQQLDIINERYNGKNLGKSFGTQDGQRYVKEIGNAWQKAYSDALISDFGRDPIYNGVDWVKECPMMNMYSAYYLNDNT